MTNNNAYASFPCLSAQYLTLIFVLCTISPQDWPLSPRSLWRKTTHDGHTYCRICTGPWADRGWPVVSSCAHRRVSSAGGAWLWMVKVGDSDERTFWHEHTTYAHLLQFPTHAHKQSHICIFPPHTTQEYTRHTIHQHTTCRKTSVGEGPLGLRAL